MCCGADLIRQQFQGFAYTYTAVGKLPFRGDFRKRNQHKSTFLRGRMRNGQLRRIHDGIAENYYIYIQCTRGVESVIGGSAQCLFDFLGDLQKYLRRSSKKPGQCRIGKVRCARRTIHGGSLEDGCLGCYFKSIFAQKFNRSIKGIFCIADIAAQSKGNFMMTFEALLQLATLLNISIRRLHKAAK